MEWNDVLRVALDAARSAAAIHQQYVGRVRPEEWSHKGSADFVSYVDREAERTIVQYIRATFPEHDILAEESVADHDTGAHWASRDWVWLVDPLDGTTNFLHGYPVYSASVAAAHCGKLVAGAVVSGPTGQEWCAARGQGATLDGRPIRVSTTDHLAWALIGTGFPFKNLALMPGYLNQFDSVMRHTAGVRRAGSAALDLCHVAVGHFDGFWELDLHPWDMAAGALLVREAGGVITGLRGAFDPFERGGVLAGNSVIHEALRNLLQRAS
jgi:myo-inositol-1(or 4)-monophosphatase